jgi:hypothetical protein
LDVFSTDRALRNTQNEAGFWCGKTPQVHHAEWPERTGNANSPNQLLAHVELEVVTQTAHKEDMRIKNRAADKLLDQRKFPVLSGVMGQHGLHAGDSIRLRL